MYGRLIIGGRLQVDFAATIGSKPAFALLHESSAQAKASDFRKNVERENSADVTDRLRNCETYDLAGKLAVLSILSDHGDGLSSRYESAQVHLCVGDARRETNLIDPPQAIEVGSTKIAKYKVHSFSVQGVMAGRKRSVRIQNDPGDCKELRVWSRTFSTRSIAMIAIHSLLRFS